MPLSPPKMSADSLSGLIKWLARDHWRDAFQEVLDEHFGEAREGLGVETFEEIGDLVGDHRMETLWGCAFRDFLTREPKHGNIVDDYIRCRGWSEKAVNKAYMEALRDSVMSLYEVSDIRPGDSFMAFDLIRGAHPIRVHERNASKLLKQWDRVAMRIVEVYGRWMTSGDILPFARALSEEVIADVRVLVDAAPMAVEEMFEAAGETTPAEDLEDFAFEVAMRTATPIFTRAWLDYHLAYVGAPELSAPLNADGEEIESIQLQYRLKKGVTQEQVWAVLDGSPELEAASSRAWNWLSSVEDTVPARSQKSRARMIMYRLDDGSTVLGTLELKGWGLEVEVNSECRAERARAFLNPLLEGLATPPLVVRQTSEWAMAARSGDSGPRTRGGLSFEEDREFVRQVLDRQYRAILDEPMPMLDNLSPREAAGSKEGCEKLVAWLKYLETAPPMLAKAINWRPTTSAGCGKNWVLRNSGSDGPPLFLQLPFFEKNMGPLGQSHADASANPGLIWRDLTADNVFVPRAARQEFGKGDGPVDKG